MAQRSRKRGRRGPAKARPAAKPAPVKATVAKATVAEPAKATVAEPAKPKRPGQWFVPTGEELTRSQRRDAEARANLKPLGPESARR